MYAERLLPHNQEAEEALIGSLLLDTEAFLSIAQTVCAEDFYGERPMQVFAAMTALSERGLPTDQIAVANELIQRNSLETVGGHEYLAHCIAMVPSPLYAPHYAEIVRQKSAARRMIQLGGEMAAAGYDSDVDQAVDVAGRLYTEAYQRAKKSGPKRLGDLYGAIAHKLEAMFSPRLDGTVLGVTTGLRQLDRAIDGLIPGLTYIVGARTSMGKTEFLAHMTLAVAGTGKDVLIFANEGREEHWAERFSYHVANVRKEDLFNPLKAEYVRDRLWNAAAQVADLPIYLLSSPDLDTAAIRAHVLTHKARNPERLGLVIYDQIDLTKDEADSEVQRRKDAISNLNGTAQVADVPMVIAAQLNRNVEERADKRPTMHDLRYGGDLEQHAQGIILLFRASYYVDRGDDRMRMHDDAAGKGWRDYDDRIDRTRLEIYVDKMTGGAVGRVYAYYDPARHKMADWKEDR